MEKAVFFVSLKSNKAERHHLEIVDYNGDPKTFIDWVAGQIKSFERAYQALSVVVSANIIR